MKDARHRGHDEDFTCCDSEEIAKEVYEYGISKSHPDREAKIARLKRNGFVIEREDSNGYTVFKRRERKVVSTDWLG